ncbi:MULTISPECIES: RICIN domain-containing protein [Streptomyces]|uniref:Ricin B lectin domain-containing protein n=1 Tax=Streptomyces ramulosus TaxID=47762 RepID=A0ABW1FHC3_9ACTN
MNPAVGRLALAPFSVPNNPPEYPIVGSGFSNLKEEWTVRPAGPGKYTINSTTHPDAAWSRLEGGIVASEGSWSQFAIEPAGDGAYVIKSPNTDEVATLNSARGEQLHTERFKGSPSQLWKFERVGQ